MFNKTKAPEAQNKSNPPPIAASVIGPTLKFKGGELSSDEDLIIEGTVEGTIAHQSHQLTIRETGKVKADVHARVIIVEGTIEGNIQGDEAVHVASTARVVGDVVSPRVSIADGASFEGVVRTSRASPGTELESPAAERRIAERRARLADFTGNVGLHARQKALSEESDEALRR